MLEYEKGSFIPDELGLGMKLMSFHYGSCRERDLPFKFAMPDIFIFRGYIKKRYPGIVHSFGFDDRGRLFESSEKIEPNNIKVHIFLSFLNNFVSIDTHFGLVVHLS